MQCLMKSLWNWSSIRGFISIHRSTIFARNTLCDRTTTDFKKILVKMFFKPLFCHQFVTTVSPQPVIIASTVLRNSLYDSQAKWWLSTRYHWFKGYKLHVCTPTKRIILSYVLITANRNAVALTHRLLSFLQEWNIEFALGDASYDNEYIRKVAEQIRIFLVCPINRRNSKERNEAYGRVIPVFLKTRFGK